MLPDDDLATTVSEIAHLTGAAAPASTGSADTVSMTPRER